jgi:hypothetical protein
MTLRCSSTIVPEIVPVTVCADADADRRAATRTTGRQRNAPDLEMDMHPSYWRQGHIRLYR